MTYNHLQSPEDNLSRILKLQNEAGITQSLYSGAEPLSVLVAKVALNALAISDAGAIQSTAGEGEGGGAGPAAAGDLTGTTLAANIVDSSITSVGAGHTLVKVASVTLTNAQIKALPTTAVQVIAAPGAGKLIYPVSAFVILDTTAGVYTDN